MPPGTTECACRICGLGQEVLSSMPWVGSIAEGGADVVGWRELLE